MTEGPRPPRQQGLFGPLEPEPGPPVRPIDVDPGIADLAARQPADLRLGTSSWSFPGWRGLVYARDAKPNQLAGHGLAAYARHPLLRTVGVDRTFYAPIDRADYAAMAAAVPDDFRFLVKVFGECTTPFVRGAGGRPGGASARYLDPAATTDLAIAPAVEGLGQKLGQLLFQFSPQGAKVTRAPGRFAERVHAFFAALPRVPCAVELRDAALLTKELTAALAATGVRFCYSLHPRMPSLAQQQAIAPIDTALADPVLVRWMLHPGLGYDEAKEHYQPFAQLVDPDPDSRRAIVDLASAALAQRLPVTIVVNNKAEGSAPLSLVELARCFALAR